MTDFNVCNLSGGSIIRRIVLGTILLIVFITIALFAYYKSYVNAPGPTGQSDGNNSGKSIVITIPKGSSVKSIAAILGKESIIKNDIRFLILAKLSGYSTRLQAGEFLLPFGSKPLEILELLSSARAVSYSITIPEGLTAVEIAALFAKDGWCKEDEFLQLVGDSERIEEFGLTKGPSLEGFLYPDTYQFTKEVSGADMVIDILLDRFKKVWVEEVAEIQPVPDVDKTVTLASIVEKETAAPFERPLIAGVFHNRLKRGMRLQSDPTVVYGVADYDGVITKKHLRTPTPYNTYTIPALPVGPICNPGREAITAVLHPEPSSNLYFVSKNDGTHQFSTNLAAHNRAVQKYQRKKKVKKGK
ncbi:endolytic transglycosylase MltG [Desulforhopalus sp. 52FAK]